jgi:hypothetical protein
MDGDDAVALCQEILDLIEEIDGEKGYNVAWEEFSEGVKETVQSIKSWAEENDYCTEAQVDALNNMKSGVSRWQR